MKVLHVIPTLDRVRGGPQLAIISICEALQDIGVDVDILSTFDSFDKKETVNFGKMGKKITMLPRSRFFVRHHYSRELSNWLEKHLINYDFVHIHSIFNYPSHISAKLAYKFGVPFIIRPCGILDEWELKQNSLIKRIYIFFANFSFLRKIKGFHAVSRSEYKGLTQYFKKVPVFLIPHGIKLSKHVSHTHREDNMPLNLLFLSRLQKKKNLPSLLGAIHYAKKSGMNVRLVVAGEPNPEEPSYFDELRFLVKELSIDDIVSFEGFVVGEKKEKLLLDAHVFVLPSFQENFSVSVAEALSFGLPVFIGSKVAFAEDVISEEAGWVLDDVSDVEIFRSIKEIYESESERLRRAANAYRLASNWITWDQVGLKLRDLYQNLSSKR